MLFIALAFLGGCANRRAAVPAATAQEIVARTGHAIPPFETDAPTAELPPGVQLDRPLSSDDAVAIALWRNPQLMVDLGSLGIAEADVIDAGLIRNPRLDMLFPVGAKPFELLLTLPVDALWQRPKRVAVSQRAYEQLAQSLIQNGLDTARDARWAHTDLVYAQQRAELAREATTLRQRIAQLTAARLRAGDIGELDAVAATVEAGSAQEQLERFEHDTALAMERLRFTLGLALDRRALQVMASEASLTPPPPLDELLEKALAARPDLRAAELAVAAATQRAGWERSRIVVLSASLSSKEVGTNGILSGPGISAELPIFHHNQGLITRADAEVEVASRRYLALKQQVAFEVSQAREQLMQAQRALTSTREAVLTPLRRAAALAEDQYRSGDVSYLFVLENTRGLLDAQLRASDLEAAVQRAQAQLERSVGTR
jgi:cobalt-zinc-cadmium efflux system outer membrane protein